MKKNRNHKGISKRQAVAALAAGAAIAGTAYAMMKKKDQKALKGKASRAVDKVVRGVRSGTDKAVRDVKSGAGRAVKSAKAAARKSLSE